MTDIKYYFKNFQCSELIELNNFHIHSSNITDLSSYRVLEGQFVNIKFDNDVHVDPNSVYNFNQSVINNTINTV